MLEFGTELVPKSLSVLGGGNHIIHTPIYGAVIETPTGWVLLDTGISASALADPLALTEIYGAGLHPWGPAGDPLTVALAKVGLTVADISTAAVSHLHLDHTGGIPQLGALGVPVVIQQAELEFGLHRVAESTERAVAFYRQDFTGTETKWLPVSGDTEIAPGVRVISTPGHTPGHQSFVVELPDTGRWIFTADAADLGENLLERIPCGSVAQAGDMPAARASIHRLVDDAEKLDARLVPGHDAVFWKAIWHPRDGHR